MFNYSVKEIEKYLVMDRSIVQYVRKIEFLSSGRVLVTFNDGLTEDYEDLSTAALAIQYWMTKGK